MAGYERGPATEYEQTVVARINGKPSSLPATHRYARHVEPVVSTLRKLYPTLVSATHAGDDHSERGDLIVHTEDQVVRVELKASQSRSGRGTLANLGQNTLTALGLITDTDTWSAHRVASRYRAKVMQLLGSHPAAAGERSLPRRGRIIRDLANAGDADAVSIQQQIVALAVADRSSYIDALLSSSQSPERIRAFVRALVVQGARTSAQLRTAISAELTRDIEPFDDYTVVYANRTKNGVDVSLTDDRLFRVVDEADGWEITRGLSDDGCSLTVRASHRGLSLPVLELRLHWKNVFVGVQTPCVMVFLADLTDGRS